MTSVPQGSRLVTTVDTLVESIHFDANVKPADLAHKAMAANVQPALSNLQLHKEGEKCVQTYERER